MVRAGSRVRFCAGLVGLALALIWMAGCGSAARPTARQDADLSGERLELAQRLFAQLQWEHSSHRYRKVLDIAANLLDYYPNFANNDEVILMAVTSAHKLDESGQALALVEEFRARYPDNPLTEKVLQKSVEVALSAADTLSAAHYLIQLYDHDPESFDPAAEPPAGDWSLADLRPGQFEQLMRRFPDSELSPYLGFFQVKSLLAAGDQRGASVVLERLENEDPDEVWTKAARTLTEGGIVALARPQLRSPVSARDDLVGVLSPLTGRYAVLGNAFYEAALLAVSVANEETGREFHLQVEDTQGDPVVGALAARRLCQESGCLAVLGSLMSAPTIAAAVVTDFYGMPLISPTATNDNIWQLGGTVFQTNLTGVFETRLLAQLGVSLLLKQRYAIIHAEDAESRRHAEFFAAAVTELGAEVVATVSFPPQQTDFKDAILALRQKRPEVIFTPATVDQMILLGPQLDFYRAGALIMGLSAWNSDKLLERAGTVLERAVFPSDLALFPEHWTDEFNAGWQGENYPREATILAQRVFQAMRMLLDTQYQSGARTSDQLTIALRSRFNQRDIEADGPESFASAMRMISGGRNVPFPGDIFIESWVLAHASAQDSTELYLSPEEIPSISDRE